MVDGGGGMRANTETSRSSTRAQAATTMSTPCSVPHLNTTNNDGSVCNNVDKCSVKNTGFGSPLDNEDFFSANTVAPKNLPIIYQDFLL